MIFVTGDTHANLDIGKLSTRRFPEQKELTKEDFLIVCGDFGLVWDGSAREIYWQDWLSDKNFTTLWIDGNHENFDILYELPLTEKFDGKVREIAPDIYHLDMERAIEALDKCGWEVDYVITHCAPKSVQKMVCSWYENDSLVSFLERVRTDLKFKRWYFGHYHIGRTFGEQFEALYNRIIPME